jgi:hypothetical protein
MKRIFSTLGLCTFLVLAGCASDGSSDDEGGGEPPAASEPVPPGDVPDGLIDAPSSLPSDVSTSKYGHLDKGKVVPAKLLAEALAYFDANAVKIKNQRFITVIDFSRHSGKKRFFVIDMKSGMVEPHVVAHGSGSDSNNDGLAEKFSNESGSNASSLGFYLAAETYSGKWGRSMRLDGLSKTNSNARVRAVVIHGADYVENDRTQQGRSWGCPALPLDEKDAVIDQLRDGSLVYASQSGAP